MELPLLVFLALLSFASLAGIVGTLRALRTDGYRRLPTDHSRLP